MNKSTTTKGESYSNFLKFCGRPDGREDHEVLRYAISTSAIDNSLERQCPPTLILGFKGIGKSTAFKYLVSKSGDSIVAGFSPGQKRFASMGPSTPGLFRERFHSLFLSNALTLLKDSSQLETDRNRIEKILSPISDLVEPIKNFLVVSSSKVKGGSAFGFGLAFDFSQETEAALDKFDRDKAKKVLDRAKEKGLRVRLYIDDPEQVFPDGDIGKNALRGLVLAANEINVNFGESLGVVILLKTHVYRDIIYSDELANMLPDQIGLLSWNNKELMKAVKRRLKFAHCTYKKAFAISEQHLQQEVFTQLRNGPRDMFAWIKFAGDRAFPNPISIKEFKITSAKLGEYTFKQIKAAYKEMVPNLAATLNKIFSDNDPTSIGELTKRIADLKTNDQVFIDLHTKNVVESASDYLTFLHESGSVVTITNSKITLPYSADYGQLGEDHINTEIKLHPLLFDAIRT